MASVGESAGTPTVAALHVVSLTGLEEKFCQLFVLYNNATQAYVEAYQHVGPRNSARVMAWEVANRYHVRQRIREYEAAAASAIVIDRAALLAQDMEIIEGYRHADQVSRVEWICCRHCHGKDHKYQWIDYPEYLETLGRIAQENEERKASKRRLLEMPGDEGGYGFSPYNDPNVLCPRCEGRGSQRTVIADTSKLVGAAKAIVKGVRTTANGTEVLLHDYDKAKDRIYRATGMYPDDASSVARGAAAGAAAGASAAIAAAKAASEMTAEEAQRLYLDLV